MGKHFSLTSTDKFQLGAYRADPAGTPKGGMVVIQEIFGVNQHIRAVTDKLAQVGYASVAPALFDRQTKDFECGYTPTKSPTRASSSPIRTGMRCCATPQAAINELKSAGPVGIMGFCMGGSIAFLAACRLSGLSAAVCYYGGAIAKFADEQEKCPTMMHFGETDAAIPMTDVEMIKKKHPKDEIFTYPIAGHGFHCDERGSFHEASAKLAWQRSMDFLTKHMKK